MVLQCYSTIVKIMNTLLDLLIGGDPMPKQYKTYQIKTFVPIVVEEGPLFPHATNFQPKSHFTTRLDLLEPNLQICQINQCLQRNLTYKIDMHTNPSTRESLSFGPHDDMECLKQFHKMLSMWFCKRKLNKAK